MSEKQGMDSMPPAYDQAYPPSAAGYPPQEAGFPTQPGYNPVPQGHMAPPHGYPSAQGPPIAGMSQQSSTVVVTNQPYMTTTVVNAPQPPDYLVSSILACLCCFWPTGLCAIYYACRRNTLMAEGNSVEATRMATNARILIIASVVLGIIWIVLTVVLRVVLYSSASSSNDRYDY